MGTNETDRDPTTAAWDAPSLTAPPGSEWRCEHHGATRCAMCKTWQLHWPAGDPADEVAELVSDAEVYRIEAQAKRGDIDSMETLRLIRSLRAARFALDAAEQRAREADARATALAEAVQKAEGVEHTLAAALRGVIAWRRGKPLAELTAQDIEDDLAMAARFHDVPRAT